MLEARSNEQEETWIIEPLQLHFLFVLDIPEQVSLGASLALEEAASMLSLIQEYADIFSWSHADMLGILPELAKHRLGLHKGCRLVRQRLRWFHLARQEVIKHEVDKILVRGFIKEIQYSG